MKVYASGVAAPELRGKYDREAWLKADEQYLAAVAAECKAHSPGDALAGTEVRWPHADGYARYMVLSSKPLAVVHLEIGDAWRLPPAFERGIRLADVKACADRLAGLKSIFGGRS